MLLCRPHQSGIVAGGTDSGSLVSPGTSVIFTQVRVSLPLYVSLRGFGLGQNDSLIFGGGGEWVLTLAQGERFYWWSWLGIIVRSSFTYVHSPLRIFLFLSLPILP